MYDRESLHPGRVKLVPVPGQENTYDMTMADEPTRAGTQPTKVNLLKDATAALFGLGVDAVPDDVLKKAFELISSNTELAREKVAVEIGSYIGTGTNSESNPASLTLPPGAIFLWVYYSKDKYGGQNYYPLSRVQSSINIVYQQKNFDTGRISRNGLAVDSTYNSYGKFVDSVFYWFVKERSGAETYAAYALNESGTEYKYICFYK